MTAKSENEGLNISNDGGPWTKMNEILEPLWIRQHIQQEERLIPQSDWNNGLAFARGASILKSTLVC